MIYLAITAAVLLATGAFLLISTIGRRNEVRRAVRDFKLRRELLEAKFVDLAAASGKPRGLRWSRCEWQPQVTYARDLQTRLLTAFVSVEVHFEAVEGGEMEEVEAVGDVRNASAIFHYRRGVWGTGGRALFNMDPSEAVDRLAGQFEPVPSVDYHRHSVG